MFNYNNLFFFLLLFLSVVVQMVCFGLWKVEQTRRKVRNYLQWTHAIVQSTQNILKELS